MSNQGKWAIVTGGSRGLGFETAKSLRAQGHQIVLVAKDKDRLVEAASQLDCEYRAVDLADLDAAKKAFEEMLESFGTPEILVLAHGVMSAKMSKTLKTDNEEWRRVMAINLDSVFCAVNTLAAPTANVKIPVSCCAVVKLHRQKKIRCICRN